MSAWQKITGKLNEVDQKFESAVAKVACHFCVTSPEFNNAAFQATGKWDAGIKKAIKPIDDAAKDFAVKVATFAHARLMLTPCRSTVRP